MGNFASIGRSLVITTLLTLMGQVLCFAQPVPDASDVDALRKELKINSLQTELDSLRKDVEELTTRVHQNRINWYGDYTMFVDNFIDDREKGKPNDSTVGVLRHRGRFGMRAQPHPFFRFTGRFSAYKNYNFTLDNPSSADPYYASARPTQDPFLRLDRAYIDFFPPTTWIAGSFGIIPTIEGRPDELKALRSIKSTVPNMLLNVTFPAATLIVHPHEIYSSLPESHMWLFYTRFASPGYRTRGNTTFSDPLTFTDKNNVEMLAGVAELDFHPAWTQTFTTVLGYFNIIDYGLGPDLSIVNSALSTQSTVFDIDETLQMGDMNRLVLHMQADNINDSGFSAFVSGGINLMKPDPVTVRIRSTGQEARIGLPGSIYNGNRFNKALYTGLAYEMPRALNKYFGPPTLGYEFYIQESGYMNRYTAGEDILERLENNGQSHQVYFTQPFTEYSRLHLSYTYRQTKYVSNFYEVDAPSAGVAQNSIRGQERVLHAVQLAWLVHF